MFEKSSAPGSEAARDKWLLQKKSKFLPKVLPQAAKLPRTSGLFKKKSFLRKSSAPGCEAAQDKGLVKKENKKQHSLRESSAPGSEAARDKWFVQKNIF